MIISHRCQFVVFSDPFQSCHWLHQALGPWSDQEVARGPRGNRQTPFFRGMSPTEAETAFAKLDLDFGAYTRVAIVQNPFRRMAELYDRLCISDPIWRLRSRLGQDVPDFTSWLYATPPDQGFILDRFLPRWRRFGLQTTQNWAAGRIDAFVRAEFAPRDLQLAFSKLDVAPAVNLAKRQKEHRFAEMLRYDRDTTDLIRHRYAADLKLYNDLCTDLRLVA